MRKDLYLSKLGDRNGGMAKRIHLEDSASRLSRNGFDVNTPFVPQRRLGPGFDFRLSPIGSHHINRRNGLPILSFDNAQVAEAFPVNDVIVRISVGLISVIPSTRVFSVRTPSAEVWNLDGSVIVTPSGSYSTRFGACLPLGRPARLNANITDSNLIEATSMITRIKAPEVAISATGLAAITSQQFLQSCGWVKCEDGLFRL